MDAKGIHQRKGLKKSQKILDHMGGTMLEDLPVTEKRIVQLEKEMNEKSIENLGVGLKITSSS